MDLLWWCPKTKVTQQTGSFLLPLFLFPFSKKIINSIDCSCQLLRWLLLARYYYFIVLKRKENCIAHVHRTGQCISFNCLVPWQLLIVESFETIVGYIVSSKDWNCRWYRTWPTIEPNLSLPVLIIPSQFLIPNSNKREEEERKTAAIVFHICLFAFEIKNK